MLIAPPQNFRIRSFVGRNSRTTRAQAHAKNTLWSAYGVDVTDACVDFRQLFGNDNPSYLEIGFGMGQTLLTAAQLHPDKNFIGVETHQPGVGALLKHAHELSITNLRVFNADAIDVLQQSIADHSLSGMQIFFPDPWQKRRHFERRLIQADFLKLVCQKLAVDGSLHLATDWEDYAMHMMKVVSQESQLKNLAGTGEFGTRSKFRPNISKFERRAIKEGRWIWEIQLSRIAF